ncbi:hypothetical protein E2C01_005308 [Portunus trituberculatus]|uniref:Uncharacterized protein n=1 Tax=Portunus trituberculatus TaxID=210409 RepID=A0A5B7CTP5_PORTR|nr:hypothetical protein [Portunus trituberculatus]
MQKKHEKTQGSLEKVKTTRHGREFVSKGRLVDTSRLLQNVAGDVVQLRRKEKRETRGKEEMEGGGKTRNGEALYEENQLISVVKARCLRPLLWERGSERPEEAQPTKIFRLRPGTEKEEEE